MQIKIIILSLILSGVAGYIGFNNRTISKLKQDLATSEQAYTAQLAENTASQAKFEKTIVSSFKKSNDVIILLKEEIELEKRKANISEQLTIKAAIDNSRIQDKYNKNINNLKALLNDSNNECINVDMPHNITHMLQTITD